MPGVADTYQGTELIDLSLVDPDNRRPVDYAARHQLLDTMTDAPPAEPAAAKLHVVRTALRLRRDHPDWFLGPESYAPLDAGSRALAFARADNAITVVPLRPVDTLTHGWGDDRVKLPDGTWTDVLTGQPVRDGRLADVLGGFPVALLVRA
jgi:(1->4)-alpha-D-glucan 1-alpha-D-glucosylmutase